MVDPQSCDELGNFLEKFGVVLENGRNIVSRVLSQKKKLTEFCGKLGEFHKKLGELALVHK